MTARLPDALFSAVMPLIGLHGLLAVTDGQLEATDLRQVMAPLMDRVTDELAALASAIEAHAGPLEVVQEPGLPPVVRPVGKEDQTTGEKP